MTGPPKYNIAVFRRSPETGALGRIGRAGHSAGLSVRTEFTRPGANQTKARESPTMPGAIPDRIHRGSGLTRAHHHGKSSSEPSGNGGWQELITEDLHCEGTRRTHRKTKQWINE